MLERMALDNVEIVGGYPSSLNRMMKSKELDMSPISSGAYPDLQDSIAILPDFCLSSVGYIRSVILISKLPIEYLHRKKVGLSSASQTSVVLLKILLSKYYNINPIYIETSPKPSLDEIDAALLIGNEALMEMREPIPYTYDLGDLWMRKTGNPIVFAVFAIQQHALKRYDREIGMIVDSYKKSLQALQTEREYLIKKAMQRYPTIDFDINTYFNLLRFDFTDELKRALEFYFAEAGELGLLRRTQSLRFKAGDPGSGD